MHGELHMASPFLAVLFQNNPKLNDFSACRNGCNPGRSLSVSLTIATSAARTSAGSCAS